MADIGLNRHAHCRPIGRGSSIWLAQARCSHKKLEGWSWGFYWISPDFLTLLGYYNSHGFIWGGWTWKPLNMLIPTSKDLTSRASASPLSVATDIFSLLSTYTVRCRYRLSCSNLVTIKPKISFNYLDFISICWRCLRFWKIRLIFSCNARIRPMSCR